jgi:hypothetical protein
MRGVPDSAVLRAIGPEESRTHSGRQPDCGVLTGVQTARTGVLASIWRPNPLLLSLVLSLSAPCKLLIFLAWGARGPGFKSRQPDQIPQRLTDARTSNYPSLESNWRPNSSVTS